MTEFNTDQNICKECNNDKRRFARLVKAQEETAWWEALQRESPKAAENTQELQQRAQEAWTEVQVLCNAAQAAIETSFRGSRKQTKTWMWEQ